MFESQILSKSIKTCDLAMKKLNVNKGLVSEKSVNDPKSQSVEIDG